MRAAATQNKRQSIESRIVLGSRDHLSPAATPLTATSEHWAGRAQTRYKGNVGASNLGQSHARCDGRSIGEEEVRINLLPVLGRAAGLTPF